MIGQCLDLTTAPPGGTVDFSSFTIDKHSAIVKWKTAFYSFYLPVALAMHMVSGHDIYLCIVMHVLKLNSYFMFIFSYYLIFYFCKLSLKFY